MSAIRNNGSLSIKENHIEINLLNEVKTVSVDKIKSVDYEEINKPNEIIPSVLLLISIIITFTNFTNKNMLLLSFIIIIFAFILRSVLKKKWENIRIVLINGDEIIYSVEQGNALIDANNINTLLSNEEKTKQATKKISLAKKVEEQYLKIDVLEEKLLSLKKIEVVEIDDFKKILLENELIITSKGGESALFSFLKIDSFLKDFKNQIIKDKKEIGTDFNTVEIKSRILEESNRNDLHKLSENLGDIAARLEGRGVKGFDGKLDQLFALGEKLVPYFENQNFLLEYYKNIACGMVAFYIADKKILYFDIYTSFEKMGVFDSSWQKNVLGRLDRIEVRLNQISNQLISLNDNFEKLIDSTNNIVHELKSINSSIITNNMLQAITAYQTWRINSKTN